MALTNPPENLNEYVNLASAVRQSPNMRLWANCDEQADVLYIYLSGPERDSDSELTDDDIIVRYHGEEVVGLTILHATQR